AAWRRKQTWRLVDTRRAGTASRTGRARTRHRRLANRAHADDSERRRYHASAGLGLRGDLTHHRTPRPDPQDTGLRAGRSGAPLPRRSARATARGFRPRGRPRDGGSHPRRRRDDPVRAVRGAAARHAPLVDAWLMAEPALAPPSALLAALEGRAWLELA